LKAHRLRNFDLILVYKVGSEKVVETRVVRTVGIGFFLGGAQNFSVRQAFEPE
jgi:hypothetical protein